MRKSNIYFGFVLAAVTAGGLLWAVHPRVARPGYQEALGQRQLLIRELELTDLCLFTEATYTRHLSQADRHAAFQDHPLAFEHFPSGGMVLPPESLKRRDHAVD